MLIFASLLCIYASAPRTIDYRRKMIYSLSDSDDVESTMEDAYLKYKKVFKKHIYTSREIKDLKYEIQMCYWREETYEYLGMRYEAFIERSSASKYKKILLEAENRLEKVGLKRDMAQIEYHKAASAFYRAYQKN